MPEVLKPNEAKREIIKLIREKATFWDSCARDYAVTAISTKDPNDLARAEAYVGRSEAAHRLEDEVLALIQTYWPVDSK